MTQRESKAIAWAAWRDSALENSDPAEHGVVPREIERTIKAQFDEWWRRREANKPRRAG
jgi:hypothetical protein